MFGVIFGIYYRDLLHGGRACIHSIMAKGYR